MSLLRKVNRELISKVISQQCALYKPKIRETDVNVYGEAVHGKFYMGPVLLECLIQRPEPGFENRDIGIDFNQTINFRFLKDDLLEANSTFNVETRFGANLKIEPGDIILYHNNYFEVNNVIGNQFYLGKNPEYAEEDNPLSDTLDNFGWDVSILATAHLTQPDRVGISNERLI